MNSLPVVWPQCVHPPLAKLGTIHGREPPGIQQEAKRGNDKKYGERETLRERRSEGGRRRVGKLEIPFALAALFFKISFQPLLLRPDLHHILVPTVFTVGCCHPSRHSSLKRRHCGHPS